MSAYSLELEAGRLSASSQATFCLEVVGLHQETQNTQKQDSSKDGEEQNLGFPKILTSWEAALSGPAGHLHPLAGGAVVQRGAAPCRRQQRQRWGGEAGPPPCLVPSFFLQLPGPPLTPCRPLTTPFLSYSRQAGGQRAEMKDKEGVRVCVDELLTTHPFG